MAQQSNSGSGFLGLLCIVFIILKLTNYIAWSWVWVLSPLWIPILFILLLLLVLGVVTFITERKK